MHRFRYLDMNNLKVSYSNPTKHILLFLLIIFLPTILFAQQIDSVVVGNGGGFTGQNTIYSISKNLVKKRTGLVSFAHVGSAKIGSCTSKKIFKKSNQIKKNISVFSKPYNNYKFIEIYAEGKSIKYTWGDPAFEVPAEIEKLYNQTIIIINKLKIK